jgi:hypothetical protein
MDSLDALNLNQLNWLDFIKNHKKTTAIAEECLCSILSG